MKRSSLIALPMTVFFSAALSSYGADIVNDTWLDGTRQDPAAPTYSEMGTDTDLDGNIESAWYGGTLTNNSPGHLTGSVGATTSSSWTTYFTTSFGTSLNLANVGDMMKVTWVFTPTGVDASGQSSQGVHLGLVQSPNGGRLSADGTPANQVYAGYGAFLNFGTVLKRSSNDNLDTMEWAVPGGANNILSTSGAWSKIGTGSGTQNNTGYTDGTSYTFIMMLTRVASGLQIDESMSGGSLNGSGTMANSFVDTTPSSFTYDTFALRPTAGSVSATSFDTTQFRVEFTAAAPEPSILALAGLGVFGMALRLRRR